MTRHVVVTGPIGIGKTTVCRRVIRSAQASGYTVRGILTPALYDERGEKIGIAICDVATGAARVLARVTEDVQRRTVGMYAFDQGALEWGRRILENAPREGCDLLAVDEVGPLELHRGGGFAVALDLVRENAVPRSLVIVREALLEAYQQRLGSVLITAFHVTAANRDQVPGEIVSHLFG